MTEKAKERGAIAGIVIAALAGLGCTSVGIWAIATMPKPYINQWVNMADEDFNFRPIMGKCKMEYIQKWAKAEGKPDPAEDITTIEDYYLSRLTVTPEIFVEDYLSYIKGWMKQVSEESRYKFTNNTIRLSDPSIKQDEQDKELFFLSFRWDQQVQYTTGTGVAVSADWYILFDNLPISLVLVEKGWKFEPNLDNDEWSGKVNIKAASGFDPVQQPTEGLVEIDKTNYQTVLTNSFFYNLNFISSYLKECRPLK